MLDIIFSIFQTVIHGITTILNAVLSVPRYLAYITNFVLTLPSFIFVPFMIIITVSVIIAIKRLVI